MFDVRERWLHELIIAQGLGDVRRADRKEKKCKWDRWEKISISTLFGERTLGRLTQRNTSVLAMTSGVNGGQCIQNLSSKTKKIGRYPCIVFVSVSTLAT